MKMFNFFKRGLESDIEVSPYGNLLSYKKGYTVDFVKKMTDKHHLGGLTIFDHLDPLDSLGFLEGYSFLERLHVYCIHDQDYSFLKRLPNLKTLMVGPSVKENNIIDLSNQGKLEQLTIKWRKGKILGLERCQNITYLCLSYFTEDDFSAISQLINLNELLVKVSTVKTVNGLSKLPALQKLMLAYCRSLKSIKDLDDLKNLTALSIERCVKIENYNYIGNLTNLASLELNDCKGLPSIKFIESLKYLNELILLGNTNILDGDMIPAKNVAKVFHLHRKHYNVKIENKEYETLIKSNLG